MQLHGLHAAVVREGDGVGVLVLAGGRVADLEETGGARRGRELRVADGEGAGGVADERRGVEEAVAAEGDVDAAVFLEADEDVAELDGAAVAGLAAGLEVRGLSLARRRATGARRAGERDGDERGGAGDAAQTSGSMVSMSG